MKNYKITKIYLKFLKQYIHNRKDLIFISQLFAFVSLLKANYEKQDIKIFLKSLSFELIDTKKLLKIINNNISEIIPDELTKYILSFFNIKNNYDNFLSIITKFCKIYILHTKTKKINYFFDKKYNDEDNKNSVNNYMLITQLIGELNNNVKILLIENYANTIKFAKQIFLKVNLYE